MKTCLKELEFFVWDSHKIIGTLLLNNFNYGLVTLKYHWFVKLKKKTRNHFYKIKWKHPTSGKYYVATLLVSWDSEFFVLQCYLVICIIRNMLEKTLICVISLETWWYAFYFELICYLSKTSLKYFYLTRDRRKNAFSKFQSLKFSESSINFIHVLWYSVWHHSILYMNLQI